MHSNSTIWSDGKYLDRVKITLYDSRSKLNICQCHVMQDHWESASQNTLRHQKMYHHLSAAVQMTLDLEANNQTNNMLYVIFCLATVNVKRLKVQTFPLTGKPEQQRFTTRSGVLTGTGSKWRRTIRRTILNCLSFFSVNNTITGCAVASALL